MILLILDFGGQTTQLISRRTRELGVYSIIKPYDISLESIEELAPQGIILSGGPKSVNDLNAPKLDKNFFKKMISLKIPVLGICYGMQLMAQMLGGVVLKSNVKEYGKSILSTNYLDTIILNNIKYPIVWFSHGDSVTRMPIGFFKTASSNGDSVSVMENAKDNLYAVQFHPEVSHTENGREMLANFLAACKFDFSYKSTDFVQDRIDEIKLCNGRAICALSGGVDSTVAAIIASKALGDKLDCIYIDTGYMRLNESDEIMKAYESMNLRVTKINASEIFYKNLKGVTDPEQKRKIIGKTFIDVFETTVKNMHKEEPINILIDGTIYPDLVESGKSGTSKAVIKSHHNVGGLPEKMNFKIISPLRDLFKDEVRKVGTKLEISSAILKRHPFPGPGLAIRIVGEATPEDVVILQRADHILTDEIKKAGLYDDIWQLFAALLPVRTVGVQGDERTYGKMCLIRAVQGDDAMSMNWYKIPHDVLETISTRITNEIKEINRVVYDVSNKPPSTIEME